MGGRVGSAASATVRGRRAARARPWRRGGAGEGELRVAERLSEQKGEEESRVCQTGPRVGSLLIRHLP